MLLSASPCNIPTQLCLCFAFYLYYQRILLSLSVGLLILPSDLWVAVTFYIPTPSQLLQTQTPYLIRFSPWLRQTEIELSVYLCCSGVCAWQKWTALFPSLAFSASSLPFPPLTIIFQHKPISKIDLWPQTEIHPHVIHWHSNEQCNEGFCCYNFLTFLQTLGGPECWQVLWRVEETEGNRDWYNMYVKMEGEFCLNKRRQIECPFKMMTPSLDES